MNSGFVDKTLRDLDVIHATRYPHIKFVMLWTIFEAWTAESSKAWIIAQGGKEEAMESQKSQIDWFRANKNRLKDEADGFWTVSMHVKGLASIASRIGQKICQMGKSKRDPNNLYQADPANKEDVTALMFEIRHKIVHGSYQHDWSASKDTDEKQLVELAASLLDQWIRVAHVKGVFN